ncbi:hypothetical protein ACFYYR_06555 [Streptomyces sp. NPDC001922]|uniref:hypothetical protein n=1 Tax=Streptomyces sp. NPDC001922 TaxID=3364624 RepID=UPI00369533AB
MVGELALDAKRGRVGIVMDAQGGRVFLRRPEGGREWEAPPEDVRPVPVVKKVQRTKSGTGGASRRAL